MPETEAEYFADAEGRFYISIRNWTALQQGSPQPGGT